MNGVGVVGKEENDAGLLENALKVVGVVGKAGKAVGLLEKDVGDVGKEGKNRGLLAKGTKGVVVVGNPENPVGLWENAAKGVVGKEENAVGLLAKGGGVVAKAGGVVAKAGDVGCRRRKTAGGVAVLKVGGRAVVSNNLQEKVCLHDIFVTGFHHPRPNFSVLAQIFKDFSTLRNDALFLSMNR